MAEAVFFRCGINIYCLRINRMDSIKKDTNKQEAYFKILIHTSSVHDESINIRINHLLSEQDYNYLDKIQSKNNDLLDIIQS